MFQTSPSGSTGVITTSSSPIVSHTTLTLASPSSFSTECGEREPRERPKEDEEEEEEEGRVEDRGDGGDTQRHIDEDIDVDIDVANDVHSGVCCSS